jgi:hypothetical protein
MKDRAAVAATVVMQIIRSRVGAVFRGQPTTLAQGEIEAFLRNEFDEAAMEAINNFRNNRPAA